MKIIVKARYDIETEDLDKTVESFTKQVSELGGYIEYPVFARIVQILQYAYLSESLIFLSILQRIPAG